MSVKRIRLIFVVVFILTIVIVVLLINEKNSNNISDDKQDDYTEENFKSIQYINLTSDICEKQETENKKTVCMNRYNLKNVVLEKNSKKCLTLDAGFRDKCLLNLVTRSLNLDLCQAITDNTKKSYCASVIISTMGDVKYCDMHHKNDPFEVTECKDRMMAHKLHKIENSSIYNCENVKTLEYTSLCFQNFFNKRFDGDCSKVPVEYENYCLATTNNFRTKEDCDLIAFDDYREYCNAVVEANGDKYKIAKIDSDSDGLADGDELFTRTDMHNPDTDGDGINDGDELFKHHTNPKEKDTDKDGLSDYDEIFKYKTNSGNPDTDGDGILDGGEIKNGTNPCTGDSDKDRLLDIDEEKFGTDINNPDTDGDGMSDFEEFKSGFDPLKSGKILADTDGDGLFDIDEIFYGTDRFNPDTDGDGINDIDEVDNLTNPLGEGDMDFDGDGISDKDEEKYKTSPTLPDTDNDGISDYEEIFIYKTDPIKKED